MVTEMCPPSAHPPESKKEQCKVFLKENEHPLFPYTVKIFQLNNMCTSVAYSQNEKKEW